MSRGFKNIESFFFIGIGGIGMSNLARYFMAGGYAVAGYDKTASPLTASLIEEGCPITFTDDPDTVPAVFINPSTRDTSIIVYTPAIPSSNAILDYYRKLGFRVEKRAAILGIISGGYKTIAVAGTHGKTTISTITSHLLKQSAVDCSAFLGGISRNYNTNLLIGEGNIAVMEADEYDRSFLHLEPFLASISSMDADHLDIYGTRDSMIEGFREFASRIRKGGILFVNSKIKSLLSSPEGVRMYSYGLDQGCDYRAVNIEHHDGYYQFDIETPGETVTGLRLPMPGLVNIENTTVAAAMALNLGVTAEEIRKSLIYFKGVVRRFDIRFSSEKKAYIDDYAHHPEELDAFIAAIRDFFPGKKITGIFQPHLFTRTRDHADAFAASLDRLDRVLLLPIYPAREEPLVGVNSEMILSKMKNRDSRIEKMDNLVNSIDWDEVEVLVTIGAGDIDRVVEKLEERIKGG